VAADGGGHSFGSGEAGGDLNSTANLRTSATSGGAPGKVNSAPVPLLRWCGSPGGEVQLLFERTAGTVYTLMGSAELLTESWEVVRSIQASGTNGLGVVPLNISEAGTCRFFVVTSP
jgi:hypothetical protein